MGIDPFLMAQIKELIPPGQYTYVTPAITLAVCIQESGGSPVFRPEPPDAVFIANLKAAAEVTTLPMQLLYDAMRIHQGPMTNRIAKFRFEPSYWEWTATKKLSSATERFLCSCSIGVGQQMMRWILPTQQDKWLEFIERFKGDIQLQLKYLIGALEKLLESTEGDLFKAYLGYNSGNIHCTDPTVVQRALAVVALRDKIQKEMQG